ncbi:MAG: hypothetical protein WAZ98_14100 [Cyclobacteriaceae bacterium]
MKKVFTLILSIASVVAFAQHAIKLQVRYIPDHSYTIETKTVTNMVMDAQADEATKEQLKASGVTLPMVMDMSQDMTAVMKTGKLNEQKEVPVTLEYTQINSTSKMGDMVLPSQPNPVKGMKGIGRGTEQGNLKIDQVEGEGVNEATKKVISGMADQIGTFIAFPEKPLKVGDEFTHEVPFSMPIQGGSELKMVIKTVYKLKSFDNDFANFDTVISMGVDMSVEKAATINASGAGTGIMVFDIKKNFLASTTSNIDMTMKMKMGPMDMDIKSSSKTEQKISHL